MTQEVELNAEQAKEDEEVMTAIKSVAWPEFKGTQVVKTGESECRISDVASLGKWVLEFGDRTVNIPSDEMDEIREPNDGGILNL